MDAIPLSQRTIEPLGGKKTIRLCAAISVPRIGWNDFWGCAQEALFELRIPIRKYTGCFWGQLLQNNLENCVRDGMEYVLCLDFDTMFSASHVKRILQHAVTNPNADAIAGLQRKRQSEAALMARVDGKDVTVNEALIPMDSAHFGFTLVKVEALKRTPKPWLQEHANEHGEWGDGSVAPDNHFWNQWKLAGNSLFVAADIRVGHLEVMVSEFDAELKPRHVHISEWTKANRPHDINACMD